MTHPEMQFDPQTLLEDMRRLRMFYEIYPDLSCQADDAASTSFEIALQIEVEEHRPADHPESRKGLSVLSGVAGSLVQRVSTDLRYSVEMPAAYHTLHPAEDGNRPRMALTLSLVFTDVGPFTRLEEPGLLTQLRAELALLGIPRRKSYFRRQ